MEHCLLLSCVLGAARAELARSEVQRGVCTRVAHDTHVLKCYYSCARGEYVDFVKHYVRTATINKQPCAQLPAMLPATLAAVRVALLAALCVLGAAGAELARSEVLRGSIWYTRVA